MKKKFLSLMVVLCMMLTGFCMVSAAEAVTEYTYYAAAGSEITPNSIATDAAAAGVVWENGDAALDTSVMGRRVFYGTNGTTKVKGILNVGVKKWSSYQNNEAMTIGSDIAPSGSDDHWRYMTSKDADTGLAVYAADPLNANNTVVQYNGGKIDGVKKNQIAYYPATSVAFADGYSVEVKLLIPATVPNDYIYQIYLYDTNNDGAYREDLQVKWTGKSFAFKINGVSATTNPKAVAGEWLNLKLTVKNGMTTVSESGTEYATAACKTTSDFYYLYLKDVSYGTGNSAYVDDVKVTNESTTDYIYYADFENEYQYNYIQDTSAQIQNIAVNNTVAFVSETGVESGYSAEFFANASADITKLGAYNTKTSVAGFDEPITIAWNVYKKSNAFRENFQGYEESGIGGAPSFEPFTGDAVGKTVEYEDATLGVDSNKWLKYTSSAKDATAMFWENEYIDGIVEVGFTLRAEDIYTAGDLAMPIMGNRQSAEEFLYNIQTDESGNIVSSKTCKGDANIALIDLHMAFGTKGGSIYFKNYANGHRTVSSGNHYIVKNGELLADTDYQLTFLIDLNTDTFTYTLNGVACEEVFNTHVDEAFLSQIRFWQSKAPEAPMTFYLDDIFCEKWLTLSAPIAQYKTVYQGDEALLPATVPVLLSDGKIVENAIVTWDEGVDTSVAGTKTVSGAVEGLSENVTMTVTVSAYPYEISAPVLEYGEKEVFGLINGGKVSVLSVKKISNETIPGKIYAALYHGGKLLNIGVSDIDTVSAWEKDSLKDLAVDLAISVPEEINIDDCVLRCYLLNADVKPLAFACELRNGSETGTPAIWMAGDSTAARYSDTRKPETGWMEYFATSYAQNLTVQNGTINGLGGVSGVGAIGGQSSKSYVDQGRLDKIIANAKPGDYLFVQFGHNDDHAETYRHTDPGDWADEEKTVWVPGTYEEYITKFVLAAREAGMKPVILTSVARATYDANGNFTGWTKARLGRYAQGAKYVAELYHVPVVDVFTETCSILENMTQEETKQYYLYLDKCTAASDEDCVNIIDGQKNHALWCANFPDGATDSTHLNFYGAEWISDIVYNGLCEIMVPVADLLIAE